MILHCPVKEKLPWLSLPLKNLGMGENVIPIILRDLDAKASLMVWALPELTGQNLAPPTVEGGFLKWDVRAQIEAWLQWGRKKGLL